MEVCKHCGPDSRVMIMGDASLGHFSWIIAEGIECFVFNFDRLKTLYSIARSMNKRARIHIELETGMNRTGFRSTEWVPLASELQNQADCLEVCGMCTHFAGAESVGNYRRIEKQKKLFSVSLWQSERADEL